MFDYSNLFGLMASKGITRKELAQKIGMAQTYFSSVLRKGRPFTTDVVYRIAMVFDIQPEDIGRYFFVLKV